MDTETVKTDVLVVGAGSAGIMAAIRAQEGGAEVLMTTSGALGKDSAVTWMTGGGFQCASLFTPITDPAKNTPCHAVYCLSEDINPVVILGGSNELTLYLPMFLISYLSMSDQSVSLAANSSLSRSVVGLTTSSQYSSPWVTALVCINLKFGLKAIYFAGST